MYNKLKNLLDYSIEHFVKILITASVIAIAITCIGITVTESWGMMFEYSEDEYEILKQEATDIIQNEDFDREGYICSTTDYNFKEKLGSMNISNGDISVRAIITGEEINIKIPSRFRIYSASIILLVLVPILIICSSYAIFLILLLIIYGITNICIGIKRE